MKKLTSVCAFVLLAFLFIAGIAQEPVQSATDDKESAAIQSRKNQKPEPNETGVLSLSDLGHNENVVRQLDLGSPDATAGVILGRDAEPNNTAATASPLVGTGGKVSGNLFPNGDIDYYSFSATAGDRIYAATMTSFSAGSTDSQLTLYASDGTTVIEFDDNNGSFTGSSSTIAGATIPTTGTYYLRVNDFSTTSSERPYDLWFNRQSGTPTPEVESNDTPATANVLPTSGWVSGARNPAAATEQDWYSMTLNAGDTVYLGLDLDPERDGTTWNGRLGMGLFGDANNQILVVDDAGATETPTTIPSEAMFVTVRTAGTYYAFVDSATAATGGPTATYHLSVTILPRQIPAGVTCTTYASTNVPQTIGPGAGLVSSTITVPGNPRIYSVRPTLDLNHALMADLDVHLRSPAGNDNGIFSDIGAAATGGQTIMNTTFDDEAGAPPSFTVLNGLILRPELNYRLGWFRGENAGGTWTLDIRDDTTNTSGGTLNNWSLEICSQPLPTTGTAVFITDFESGAAGFTHSGTLDEWELGTPATAATAGGVAAFTTCNSGVNCWKTDLDNTYEASSSQDLLSPNINLTNVVGPINLQWAMKYQMESASFDHANVRVREVGNPASERTVWEFLDATMTDAVGSPSVTIGESAGWGTYSADISSFAGKNIELIFHLDSDSTVNLAGMAIDDVVIRGSTGATVTGTKTVSGSPFIAGNNVTYTVTLNNSGTGGQADNPGNEFIDVLPAGLTLVSATSTSGTTVATVGTNTVTFNGAIPAGGSVTITINATIKPDTTGVVSNQGTINYDGDGNGTNETSVLTDDPGVAGTANPTNFTATASANLSVTVTDSPDPVIAGTNLTYTITVNNAGPSNAAAASLSDPIPTNTTFVSLTPAAGFSCSTPAVGGVGTVTCNNPSLAPGTSVFTLVVQVSNGAAAGSTITNTATVSSTTADPNGANNSATATTTVIGNADLAVTSLTDAPDPVTAGTNLVYTFSVANNGPSDAVTAVITDNLPAGTTFVSIVQNTGPAFTCTNPGVGNNGTVSCTRASFVNGATASFTLTVRVAASILTGSTISNTVSISSATGDATPGNNSATTTTSVGTLTDLVLQMSGSVSAVPAGSNTIFTIRLNNSGPSDAANVVLLNQIPAGTTYQSISFPAGWKCRAPAVGTRGNVRCTKVAFEAGDEAVFALRVRVNPTTAAGSSIFNQATVSTDSPETSLTNNAASATISVSAGGGGTTRK